MSQLILYWLNSRLHLSKQIEDVDKEFASGYLLGELLHRLGILKDPSKLQNSSKAVHQNFEAVKEPLKSMGIAFDPAQIQSRVPGAALKLLYAIKLKVEPESTKGDPESKSPSETLVKSKKPATTALKGKDAANQQLGKKLEKFEKAKTQLYQKAAESVALEKSMKAQTVKQRITQHNQTLRENKTFLKEWMKNGLKNWFQNQQTAKARIEKQQKFEQDAVEKYKATLQKKKEEGTKEVKEGIEGFERNLQRLGIDIQEQTMDDDDNAAESKKKKKQPFSIVAAMTKIREKKTLADFARKEKERRQRKTQVDQAKAQAEIERLYKESEMLSRLQKEAAKSRAQCYCSWRGEECQKLIDDLAKEAEEGRQKRTKAQMQEYLKRKELENVEYAKKRKADLQVSRKKFAEEEKAKKVHRRGVLQKVVHQTIITQLLDIANEAYKKQLLSETHQINAKDWEQWMTSFINGDDIVPGGVTAYVTQSKAGITETGFGMDAELEKFEIKDYLYAMGLWDPDLITEGGKEALKDAECEDTEISTADPKGLEPEESDMWRWFQKVHEKLNGATQSADHPKGETLGYVPLKLGIIGKRFTPKMIVAKMLQEKYGVQPLNPRREIKRIKQIIENEAKSREETKKEEPKGKPAAQATKPAKIEKKEEPQVNSELRKIVEKIMKVPANVSEEETEKLEAEFVVTWLKQTYPKNAEQYREALKERLKRKNAIEAELKTIQDEAAAKKGGKGGSAKREQELAAELEELNKASEKGFVLVGFPKTLVQARILQAYLVPGAACENRALSTSDEISESKTLSGAVDAPAIVSWTAKSGLDGILVLDITKMECKKRGMSRKKDLDKNEYWWELLGTKPEKVGDAGIEGERLERVYWKMVQSDKQVAAIEDYYERFEEKKVEGDGMAKVWNVVDAMVPFEKVQETVRHLVDTWIHLHTASESKLIAQLESEIVAAPQAVSTPPPIPGPQTAASAEEKKVEFTAFNKEGMKDAWEKIKEKYVESMNIIFKFYRKQKGKLVSGLTEMHRQFISFLERPDEKQRLMDEFLAKLGALLSDHPDYINNAAAVKEIYQSIDELDYKLWKIVEKKKDEATAEREDKMNSGWLKQEITNSLTAAHNLMQYEINKFVDASYFLVSCPEFMAGNSLPPLFDEIVLQFDNSLVGEEPYSLISKLCNEAKKFVSEAKYDCATSNPEVKIALEKEKRIALTHLEASKYWSFALVHNIVKLSRALFERMDDLIVFSVKDENQIIKEAIKSLKEAVKENRADSHILINQLYMAPYADSSYIQKPPDELFPYQEPKTVPVDQLKSLSKVFAGACTTPELSLDGAIEILLWSIKSGTLTGALKHISTRTIAQTPLAVSSSKTYCVVCWPEIPLIELVHKIHRINWRHLLVYLALLDISYPNKEELSQYKEKLLKKSADGHEIGGIEFVEVEMWIKDCAGDRKRFIHEQLQTFDETVNIGEYVELLQAEHLVSEEARGMDGLRYWQIVFPSKQ